MLLALSFFAFLKSISGKTRGSWICQDTVWAICSKKAEQSKDPVANVIAKVDDTELEVSLNNKGQCKMQSDSKLLQSFMYLHRLQMDFTADSNTLVNSRVKEYKRWKKIITHVTNQQRYRFQGNYSKKLY